MNACKYLNTGFCHGLELERNCAMDSDTDSCPHTAALRAVVENPELVLVAQPKDCSLNCKHYDRGYKGPCDIKSSPNLESAMDGGIGDYCDEWEAR